MENNACTFPAVLLSSRTRVRGGGAMEEKIRPITIGQRLTHKRNGTVYIIRDVSDGNVVLVSENGETLMRIQLDSFRSAGFEPLHD